MKPRRAPGAPPLACIECGRPTPVPRKSRCDRCYSRAYHGRAVARACSACAQSDRRLLVRRELGGQLATVCGNCAALIGRRTMTLAELASELRTPGDRRGANRRRGDRRTPGERRYSGPGWTGAAAHVWDERRGDARRRRDGEGT